MRLTVDMRLTRNSCLINGCEIVGGAFAASAISLIQHGRASKYFGKRHSWRSHLQAHLAATCQRGTKPWNGRRATTLTKFAVSLLKDATVVGHVPREFLQVFWHFLRHGGTITCEVTGQRRRGKGLEMPCV